MSREGRKMAECVPCRLEILCREQQCVIVIKSQVPINKPCCDCVRRCETARSMDTEAK